MEKGRFKAMFIKMAGIEREIEWISKERVNIVLTAVVPSFLALLGIVIQVVGAVHSSSWLKIVKNDIFINVMQLFLISSVLYVLFHIRRKLNLDGIKEARLREYILKEANMHNKSEDNVNLAVKVTKESVAQFYKAWRVLWAIFFLYYSNNLCFSIMGEMYSVKDNLFNMTVVSNVIGNLLNYASSTAMFAVFIVLNSVTVSRRARNIYRNGLTSSYIFIILFGIVVVFPTFFSIAQSGNGYYSTQLFISFVLSIYSALTFVLMLGKLNSVYLHIPRWIYYGMYFYAIAQMFQFLLTNPTTLAMIMNTEYLNNTLPALSWIYQYLTFFGKICLSLALLWIVFESRFVYYTMQSSLEITESEYSKQIFRTFLK